MELTNEQYDLLIACFKNHLPNKAIAWISHIPINRVERERERWEACQMLALLKPPKTYKQIFNGGKTFGRRKLNHPVRGWQ